MRETVRKAVKNPFSTEGSIPISATDYDELTVRKSCFGNPLTERTSTKRVSGLSRSTGNDLSTVSVEIMEADIMTMSGCSSQNAFTSL